jgi:hypothetical protein
MNQPNESKRFYKPHFNLEQHLLNTRNNYLGNNLYCYTVWNPKTNEPSRITVKLFPRETLIHLSYSILRKKRNDRIFEQRRINGRFTHWVVVSTDNNNNS